MRSKITNFSLFDLIPPFDLHAMTVYECNIYDILYPLDCCCLAKRKKFFEYLSHPPEPVTNK